MLKRLRHQERGAVMVIAALSFTVLLLFAGLALDFGRAHLLRAQLQSAVDASALAGALQVIPMAELKIDRWVAIEETCYDPVSKQNYPCLSWESTSPARVSGPQWDLIRLGRWRNAAASQCNWPHRCSHTYTIVREWLVLPPSTVPVSESTFYKNAFWPSQGARVESVSVSVNPDKVEVTTQATLTTPTTFLKLVGIRELRLSRTGSAIPVRR